MRALAGVAMVVTGLAVGPADAADRPTLEAVRANHDMRCGVFPDDPGRSAINATGRWDGFYVDFCRAVAAAVLGNPDFVQYVEVGSKTRFSSLMDKKVDVVMYSSTWTMGRENDFRIAFPAVYLFDGQGFLVRRQSGIKGLADLRGKSICVTENTTTQKTIEDINRSRNLGAKIVYSNGDNFFRGACDAYTADRMNLATNRANRSDDATQYIILPDVVSREPIGPMVRNDDVQWTRIIRSVVHALIVAEELGLTRDNVDAALAAGRGGETDLLLGGSGNFGEQMGLTRDWAFRAIKAVGNYGEVYDRHFGPKTAIGVERGLNRLWSDGGVLYAPLFK
ncbi:MAG: amino acid ABC transporter substrate-binding protein [Phaeospirillum sp.]|nr:amino acid ABC transporter substrate-binding protein [Phaeospirillum sp.]